MAQSLEITIQNKVGFHARPATLLVKEAAKHASKIIIENLTNSSLPVDARSLLKILCSGVEQGHTIRITVGGPDETDALEAIKTLDLLQK